MDTLRVAIVGATGYGGAELVRLLARHPRARVVAATSERLAGIPLQRECPWISTDLILQTFNPEDLDADFVFLAQEAGFAMKHAPTLLKRSKVIDLSADFRLEDKDLYAQTYKRTWESPGLTEKPVYGLSEIGLRDEIAQSR
ncbi:MAG: N-acetyl-gamma-glutamyl-phosphate reductase, partial [Fimbriimonadaceae bacterium]|nr:N-acetyl-gamma-glutamyl-phosphate reductase [Fimbriimonadaceae bacterium]